MPSFRLLTINLWNERGDPDALRRLIDGYAPDVVLAQEITPEQADVLARALPYGLLAPRRDSHGMALALRWPARCERLALPERDALVVRLEKDVAPAISSELAIVNVHLSAPTRFGRMALRKRQVALLRGYLETLGPARVLAGDFNSMRVMPAYRTLCREFDDAARSHARFPAPTWSPGARLPRLLRIDHVLTRGLRSLALEVVRVRGSDHSALLATLSLENRA